MFGLFLRREAGRSDGDHGWQCGRCGCCAASQALDGRIIGSASQVRNLHVHEYAGMEIMAKYGVAVPKSGVATTPHEAEHIYKTVIGGEAARVPLRRDALRFSRGFCSAGSGGWVVGRLDVPFAGNACRGQRLRDQGAGPGRRQRPRPLQGWPEGRSAFVHVVRGNLKSSAHAPANTTR